MDENTQDRVNETVAAQVVTSWLQRMPFVGGNGTGFKLVKRVTKPRTVDHDFDVWWNHLHVGSLECKSRTYDLRFFKGFSPTISADKLNHLKKEQRKGFKAAVAYMTSDNRMMFITLDKILHNRDKLERASEEIETSTNHGKGTREPQPHYNVPFQLWTVIK